MYNFAIDDIICFGVGGHFIRNLNIFMHYSIMRINYKYNARSRPQEPLKRCEELLLLLIKIVHELGSYKQNKPPTKDFIIALQANIYETSSLEQIFESMFAYHVTNYVLFLALLCVSYFSEAKKYVLQMFHSPHLNIVTLQHLSPAIYFQ